MISNRDSWRLKHRAALSHLRECERCLHDAQQRFMRTHRDDPRAAAAEEMMDRWAAAVNWAHHQLIEVQEQWRAAEQVPLP